MGVSSIEKGGSSSEKGNEQRNSGDDRITRLDKTLGILIIAASVAGVIVTGATFSVRARPTNALGPPTLIMKPAVLLEAPQEQLDWIRIKIAANPIAATHILPRLPTDVAALENQAGDPSADAIMRAASWLCYEDPLNERDQLLRRFTMAAIYYSAGGESWSNNTNWLSEKPLCTRQDHPTEGVDTHGWWGISCCGGRYENSLQSCKDGADWQDVAGISLSENNLSGDVTLAYVLLPQLFSLDLSHNQLTGTIPGVAFGGMPNLKFLYLQHNRLTGGVPGEIARAPKLGTYAFARGHVCSCPIIHLFWGTILNWFSHTTHLSSCFTN